MKTEFKEKDLEMIRCWLKKISDDSKLIEKYLKCPQCGIPKCPTIVRN